MTRDEWILKHVPTVKAAVQWFNRVSPLRHAEDLEAEALLRLTKQAEKLCELGLLDDPLKCRPSYVTALARHACIDYLRRQETTEKHSTPVKFSEILAFSRDSSVFNGYTTEHIDRGSMIPMSEDMGADELVALEAFINCEPKNAWQRSKLKRRALNALVKLGISFDARITRYTVRAKSLEKGGDGS